MVWGLGFGGFRGLGDSGVWGSAFRVQGLDLRRRILPQYWYIKWKTHLKVR